MILNSAKGAGSGSAGLIVMGRIGVVNKKDELSVPVRVNYRFNTVSVKVLSISSIK